MSTDTFSQPEIDAIVARAFDGERVRVSSYRLVKHSKDKVGFLGNHQNLELTIERDSGESETRRFFVKGLPHLTEQQMSFIRERGLFHQEAAYFNDIRPLLKKHCPSTEDWDPECLLANDRFVVLEDMRLRDYAMSASKMLSGEQMRAAARAQARLHAASLVAQRRLGKTLVEAYPKGCTEQIFCDNMIKHKRLDLMIDLAETIAERLGRDSRRVAAGFRKGFYQMYDQNGMRTKLPKVFGHGDAWPNNYLFDGSHPMKCVLVDFQLTRYGPPMYDLALLTYLSTSRDFRRRELTEVIEVYHEELCEVLESNDPEIERPSLEDVVDEYEELRMTAFFCATMYYPIVGLDKSTFVKYDEEELYKRLMFREENSFVMQVYEEDKVFATRMNEMIEEAVEYFEEHGVPIEPKNGIH